MFRSKRSALVKRLWKCRVTKHETSRTTETESPEDLELKSVTQSMLKRLKERHLDVLVQSVESKGGETTDCVLLPRGDIRLGRRTVAPHVLCCQIWRWPELPNQEWQLKRLSCCTSAEDPTSVCCNPYHWSRLQLPDSPPPPYCKVTSEVVKPYDGPPEEPVSTETGGTPTPFRCATGGSMSNGATHRPYWCHIAYWELRQRVGRLFTVLEDSVNVFQELPHGDGMCLGVLQQVTKDTSVQRTREKIGFGVTLSREADGVWAYNRSEYPIFFNSPTLDIPNSRTSKVRKVLPGYSIRIFDYIQSEILEQTRDLLNVDGPFDPNTVRISFAKGWGPCYSRQFVTSCPCWIEVLLSINR